MIGVEGQKKTSWVLRLTPSLGCPRRVRLIELVTIPACAKVASLSGDPSMDRGSNSQKGEEDNRTGVPSLSLKGCRD
jgi:hypothetical protein